jgi:tRNA(fMet)-specific endonuclease VapC
MTSRPFETGPAFRPSPVQHGYFWLSARPLHMLVFLLPIIVAAELRFGAAKRGSVALAAQVEKVLGAMRVQPLDVPADREYGRLRLQLEQTGQLIGPNDLLIAAHALALDATVVTNNQREFQRAPGLRVENWLQTETPRHPP